MTSGTDKYYVIRENDLKHLLYDYLLMEALEQVGIVDTDKWPAACDKITKNFGDNPIVTVLEAFSDEGIIEETEMG